MLGPAEIWVDSAGEAWRPTALFADRVGCPPCLVTVDEGERRMQVSSETWQAVFKRDGGRCRYCGEDLLASFASYFSATVDHVVAKAAGGTDEPSDLVCCCPACNSMLSRGKDLTSLEQRKAYVEKRRSAEWEGYLEWRKELGRT